MKKRLLALGLALLMIMPMFASPLTILAEGNTKKVDAMFLHDTHSHLGGQFTEPVNKDTGAWWAACHGIAKSRARLSD